MNASTLRVLLFTAAATLCALPAPAQTVIGTVTDSTSGTIVPGAYVALLDQAGQTVGGTQSDSLGNFALRAPAAGSYRLRTTQLGYWVATSALIQVGATGALTIKLHLVPRPIELEGISITAAPHVRHLAEAGFYQRQKLGFGRYITRDRIERQFAMRTSDLFRDYPGVQVVVVDQVTGESDVIMRGAAMMTGCFPTIAVDGSLIRRGGRRNFTGESADFVGLDAVLPSPSEIEAVEIYPSAAGVPGQFAGISRCGALLFWTRR
jgi:hypothetical protein